MALEAIDAAQTLAELKAILHLHIHDIEFKHCNYPHPPTPELQLGDERCANCDDPIEDYEFYYHVCDAEGCRAVGFYCLECSELHNALGGYFCRVCGEWTEFD